MNSERIKPCRYEKQLLLSLRNNAEFPKDFDRIQQIYKPSPKPKNPPPNLLEILTSSIDNPKSDDLIEYLNNGLSAKKFDKTDVRTCLYDLTNKAEDLLVQSLKMTSLANNLAQKFFKINSDLSNETLKNAVEKVGNSKLLPQVTPRVKVKDFLQSGEIVQEKQVEEKSATNTLLDYKKTFVRLFENERDSNDFILDCILTEFSQKETKTKEFVGTMAFSLCKISMEENGFNSVKFVNRLPLIKNFMGSDEKCVHEVLSAIRVVHDTSKTPIAFLDDVFSYLYDFEIVSGDLFLSWRLKNKRHKECLKSLDEFFNHLQSVKDN